MRLLDYNFMKQELIDAGEVHFVALDYFEDNGGHIVHDSSLESYFEYYLHNLTEPERDELLKRIKKWEAQHELDRQ